MSEQRNESSSTGSAPDHARLSARSHIAEKLHACTLPRARPNTRVKDLPDLALLATAQPIAVERLRSALKQTFAFRNTLPARLPEPLATWTTACAAMLRDDRAMLPDVTEPLGDSSTRCSLPISRPLGSRRTGAASAARQLPASLRTSTTHRRTLPNKDNS